MGDFYFRVKRGAVITVNGVSVVRRSNNDWKGFPQSEKRGRVRGELKNFALVEVKARGHLRGAELKRLRPGSATWNRKKKSNYLRRGREFLWEKKIGARGGKL